MKHLQNIRKVSKAQFSTGGRLPGIHPTLWSQTSCSKVMRRRAVLQQQVYHFRSCFG
jgi:hypothetical protein